MNNLSGEELNEYNKAVLLCREQRNCKAVENLLDCPFILAETARELCEKWIEHIDDEEVK